MNSASDDIHCPHFGPCSGCQKDEDVGNILLFQEARDFFLKLGISPFHLHRKSAVSWRYRAKLAVQGSVLTPHIGLYKRGSHDVLDIPQCKVHHPLINCAIKIILDWIIQEGISPYEKGGLLRYLQLTVENTTNQLQVVFVFNIREDMWKGSQLALEALNKLWDARVDLWHSFWINFNPAEGNVIFSPRWHLVKGKRWLNLRIEAAKTSIRLHPGSFMQANVEVFNDLLVRLKSFVPRGTHLLEYYAGAGVIGLSLLDRCEKICFVEIFPMAKECFEESIKPLTQEEKLRLSFIVANSAKSANLLDEKFDLVIVDPPRKGLDQNLLNALCAVKKNLRLIYISCGFESFKRDCDTLLQSGWKLAHAESFLFFPGSEHLEVLAIFDS